MATNSPAYRATVYAPYSVNPAETTILTPYTPVSGGAVHADAFMVATVPTISGGTWRPYLDVPHGQHGTLNVRERSLDTGQMSVRLLDKRTGTSNLVRWMTAFVGDGAGAGLLNGRKVVIEESLNFNQVTGIGTWANYFTGRITSVSLDNSRQWYTLQLQDMSTDLDDVLFTRAPHPSATTAQAPQVTPIGLQKAWGPAAITGPITATVRAAPSTFDGQSAVDVVFNDVGALTQTVLKETYPLFSRTWGEKTTILRAYLTWSGGASSGTYRVRGMISLYRANYAGAMQHFAGVVRIALLDASEAGYTASLPAAATAVTVRIEAVQWPVSKAMPVLVGDTHPVTMLKWILDGYFGDLNLDGSPRRALARFNPTGAAGDPFYDLEQDASFLTGRWAFTEQKKRREVIESVCKQFGLAIDLTADGKATITDVRSKAAAIAGVLPALTNADVVAGTAPRWQHTRDGAVSRIDCNYYVDSRRSITNLDYWSTDLPDIGPSLLVLADEGVPVLELDVTERVLDANGKPASIDCPAFRAMYPAEVSAPDASGTIRTAREQQLRQQIRGLEEELWRLFGTGTMSIELTCRRTSIVASIRPGNYATLTVDEVPDPTTNRRGGTRLVLCTGRKEDGLTVGLSFLDCGRNAAATAPTLSAILNAADGSHAIDVTVGVTTAGAVVDYCITSTALGVRPADTDARWTRGVRRETNGTSTIGTLAGGRRVWLRASTRPLASTGFQRPSAYTYLGGTGYLDTTAITGPTLGGVGTVTKSTARIGWANTNTIDPVGVYLIQSASAPADWTLAYLVAMLPPGSTQMDLANLTAAVGSSYTWLAQAMDAAGSVSAGTGTTFVTTATTVTAPTPRALIVTNADAGGSDYGTNDASLPDTQGWGTHRYGVQLLSTPPDAGYTREIERAPDVAGVAGTYAKIGQLGGTETVYTDYLPSDGLTRWYRQRCTGLGADPSGYSTAVSAKSRRVIGSLQLAEGRGQVSTLYGADGVVADDVQQQDAASLMRIAKGVEVYQLRDGVLTNFTRTYQRPPIVVHTGGGRYRDQMMDTTVWPVGWNSTSDKRVDVSFSAGTGTVTMRAKRVQAGAATARSAEFTSKNGGALGNLTVVGDYAESGVLANAPSNNGQYIARMGPSVTVTAATPTSPTNFVLVIGVYADAGTGYVFRTDYSFSQSATGSISFSVVGSVPFGAGGLGATAKVKIVVEAFSYTGASASFSVNPYDNSPGAEGHGVTYNTSTDLEMSLTPNTDDYLTVLVIGT
jgi:hypothetical protein